MSIKLQIQQKDMWKKKECNINMARTNWKKAELFIQTDGGDEVRFLWNTYSYT